jgi:plasmid stabilization system protein ParE
VPEIRISAPAKQDLSRIWLKIADYSERSAEALSHEIHILRILEGERDLTDLF